jgi:hypothetical protein
MKEQNLVPSKLTVEDLFRAKKERRKRMANLPFEEKIEIVKKLQDVSRSLKSSREANRDRVLGRKPAKSLPEG